MAYDPTKTQAERKADHSIELGKMFIQGIPGTRLRLNEDYTVDRIYEDGRVERVQWERKP